MTDDVLVRTRLAWHALAEYVLAPARHRVTGRIGLRATDGGFGTPRFGVGEQLRVAGSELLIAHDGRVEAQRITTLAAAADAVGVEPRATTGVYTPTTPFEPDAALEIDLEAAALLAEWFAFGTSVLDELRGSATRTDAPDEVQLWPEHFDLGLALGAEATDARATYGASPGDEAHAEPYLYVAPWVPPNGDEFWNDTAFRGASFSRRALHATGDARTAALAFFARGRALQSRVPRDR